jgi:hypothetical protein
VLSTKYQAKGNYLTAVPNTYKTYADTKGSLSADGYLTAVPDTYKTYADTKTSLSDDGYALASQQVSVDAALSV